METLRAAWRARTSRERTALAIGAVAVSTLLVYSFLWEPMRAEQKRLRASLPQLRAQSAQFAADAAEAQRLRMVAQAPKRGQSARAALEAAGELTGLRANITSISELSQGRVQVVLAAVPYEAFVRWIGALAGTIGLSVESAELRPGPTPGVVFVETLVLKQAGTW